jgi:hypothetical protein
MSRPATDQHGWRNEDLRKWRSEPMTARQNP